MNTSTNFNRFLCVQALLSVLFLAACSVNSSHIETAQQAHTLKAGDIFTYHEYMTDLDSNTMTGSDTTLIATITRTGMTYFGQPNVAEIVKGQDTLHFAKVNDSTFALLQDQTDISPGAFIPSLWIPFDPSKSGSTLYDSTQQTSISSMPATVHETVIVSYLGKDVKVIGNKSLAVYKFTKTVTVTVTILGQDFTTTVTVGNDFAPSIGFFTERIVKTISNSDRSPVPNGINYSILQNYHLQ